MGHPTGSLLAHLQKLSQLSEPGLLNGHLFSYQPLNRDLRNKYELPENAHCVWKSARGGGGKIPRVHS